MHLRRRKQKSRFNEIVTATNRSGREHPEVGQGCTDERNPNVGGENGQVENGVLRSRGPVSIFLQRDEIVDVSIAENWCHQRGF
jgi:hypothetical protein